MSHLPWIMSLADDLDRLALGTSPFYTDPFYYQPSYRWPSLAIDRRERDRDLRLRERERETGPLSTIGKEGFQVCMDVNQFKPNELNVKVVDNSVIIEGKHEEREDDHGYISRHFVRRYTLPQGYDADKVQSTLSSDGVLTVSVPKPPEIEDKSRKERMIQIQQTGPAALNVKENKQEEEEGQKKK